MLPKRIRTVFVSSLLAVCCVAPIGCSKDFKTTFVPYLFHGARTFANDLLADSCDSAGTLAEGLLYALENAVYPEGTPISSSSSSSSGTTDTSTQDTSNDNGTDTSDTDTAST